MGHSRLLPPTRFEKADKVRDHDGNEGIVSEVFVTYPARGDFADWTKPSIHYQVTFFGSGPTITATRLHLEGELTDSVQTQLPFTNENPLSTSNTRAWEYEQLQ